MHLNLDHHLQTVEQTQAVLEAPKNINKCLTRVDIKRSLKLNIIIFKEISLRYFSHILSGHKQQFACSPAQWSEQPQLHLKVLGLRNVLALTGFSCLCNSLDKFSGAPAPFCVPKGIL